MHVLNHSHLLYYILSIIIFLLFAIVLLLGWRKYESTFENKYSPIPINIVNSNINNKNNELTSIDEIDLDSDSYSTLPAYNLFLAIVSNYAPNKQAAIIDKHHEREMKRMDTEDKESQRRHKEVTDKQNQGYNVEIKKERDRHNEEISKGEREYNQWWWNHMYESWNQSGTMLVIATTIIAVCITCCCIHIC